MGEPVLQEHHRRALEAQTRQPLVQCFDNRYLADQHPDRPLEIVELGSFVGQSALALAKGFGPAGGKVFCIDTWKGTPGDETAELAKNADIFEVFKRNVGDQLCKTIFPITGTTLESAQKCANEELDMVFIDADHSYEAVLADIKAWLSKVKAGGIICGHDYGTIAYTGVTRAVAEVFQGAITQMGDCLWVTHIISHNKAEENGQAVHEEALA